VTPRQLAATAAIAILSGAIIPAAQPDAKPWSGILRDDRRQPIAGATVRLESGGHHETATTAQDGSFAFAALAPASYSIAVAYQGVTAACPQPVQLPRDSAAVLELSAGHALSLVDEAQAPAGTGGQKLSAKAVSELP
jgi:hypothetical protein